MKKLLKEKIKTLSTIIITSIVATTTTIFAYTLIAENVGYTPKDTTWDVENVDAAVDDLHERVELDLLNKVYPIGSIYLGVSDRNPSEFIGGEWEQVAQGRTLFGEGTLNNITYTAGETVDAGLPDHKHYGYASSHDVNNSTSQGYPYGNNHITYRTSDRGGSYYTSLNQSLASVYNPIYGNSTTVQPNAYVVYMFKRVK